MIRRCLTAAAFAVFSVPALAQDGLGNSIWENQSGSTLYIDEVRDDGHFHGRYVNAASGYACQGGEYRVVGDIFEPLIAFSVAWRAESETCHTITSWTGDIDGSTIRTEWSLVRLGDEGVGRFLGESIFVRQEGE